MSKQIFQYQSEVGGSAQEVFHWHEKPEAFQRLFPPWVKVEILERKGTIRDGDRLTLQLKLGPFAKKWVAEHRDYIAGKQFRDVQIAGPFSHWEHLHLFKPASDNSCLVEDYAEYQLPTGMIGSFINASTVQKQLQNVFAYRHRILQNDFRIINQFKAESLKVGITGSSGLVGSHLSSFLSTSGHQVFTLVRSKQTDHENSIYWNPQKKEVQQQALEKLDAIVHLAAENIASGKWNEEKKKKIMESRREGTRFLCETIARLNPPPKTLVCASAIGYYGNRGDELLTEESAPGSNFLAEVSQEWEQATEPARNAGIRVVNLRIGVVLSPDGGVLSRLLIPFKMGAGGKLGSGKQFMSWIALDDLLYVIYHCLTSETLNGPVNATAPNPVTNEEFTKTFAKVLSRPAFMNVPVFAPKLALGEMADELLFTSQRVVPAVLTKAGHPFQFPELENALRHVLGKL